MSSNDQTASFSVNKSHSGSRYTLSYYTPSDYQGTVTLPASGSVKTSWQLQAGTFHNLCRSILVGNLVTGAQSAKDLFMGLLVDKPPVERVRLVVNSVPICEINDADIYSKITRMYCSKLSDYLCNPPVVNGADGDDITGQGNRCCFFQPAGIALAANAANTRYSGMIIINASGGGAAPYVYTTSGSTSNGIEGPLNPFLGPQVVISSAKAADPPVAANGLFLPFKLELGQVWPDSYFGLDKTVLLPGIVTLEVYWAGMDRQGAQSATVATLAYNSNLPAGSIQNLQLGLAVEMSDDVKAKVRADFEKGYEMFIPFPINNGPTSLGTSTNITISYPLNIGNGRSLLRVWSTFSAAVSNLGSGNTMNAGGVRVQSVWTQLGQTYLQPSALVVTDQTVNGQVTGVNGNSTYYEHQLPLVRESALPEGERSFYRNFCHCDNFVDSEPIAKDFREKLSLASGVPLFPQAISYNMTIGKRNIADTLFQWFVLQKLLTIRSTGVSVV